MSLVHFVDVAGLDDQEYPVLEYRVVVVGRMNRQFIALDAVDAVKSMAEHDVEVEEFNRIRSWVVVRLTAAESIL